MGRKWTQPGRGVGVRSGRRQLEGMWQVNSTNCLHSIGKHRLGKVAASNSRLCVLLVLQFSPHRFSGAVNILKPDQHTLGLYAHDYSAKDKVGGPWRVVRANRGDQKAGGPWPRSNTRRHRRPCVPPAVITVLGQPGQTCPTSSSNPSTGPAP